MKTTQIRGSVHTHARWFSLAFLGSLSFDAALPWLLFALDLAFAFGPADGFFLAGGSGFSSGMVRRSRGGCCYGIVAALLYPPGRTTSFGGLRRLCKLCYGPRATPRLHDSRTNRRRAGNDPVQQLALRSFLAIDLSRLS